ncbi:hypothetical protein SV7mr_22930 [Stieleria bergensis]|uniref:DUF1553 domain-containing protein n=1 Tax=Stieleria bergensis TaxID=2528025 RepID=A0A517SUK7_9BACT|nr:hypothetical protein SV7mr_22930 [Planctomycetes bacterium SV_7m_r]
MTTKQPASAAAMFIRLSLSLALVVTLGTLVGISDGPTPGTHDSIQEQPINDFDRDHWSYLPLQRPSVPAVKHRRWARTPIDRYVLKHLEAKGLQPLPITTRRVWARRVSWDLIGIPPSPRDLQAFLDDDRPGAQEAYVDRLLASPQYGQRWAQPWLDLARFAETDGYEHDKIRPQAWKYRDWVVQALNQDLPYDQFVQFQIAGDLLKPASGTALDAALGTAFCLSGPDMPDINLTEERRHVLMNEITSSVGAVFLGLQIGCAQCHDHKYDAISQADFYRLRAFFEDAVQLKKNQSVTVFSPPQTKVPTHLMNRGDFRRRGPRVAPAFPRVLNANAALVNDQTEPRQQLARWLTSEAQPLTARVVANRLWQYHFGKGLTSTPEDLGLIGDTPTHPQLLDFLASELIANDWSLKALQRQILLSSVYQTIGSQPQQQASLKQWQQSLVSDPNNETLVRFPRRRLTAEQIRDGMLAASETLNREMGGPGIMPALPTELIKTLKSGQWKTNPDPNTHARRSIYLFARRNLRYPFFATFDRPAANQSCACRVESTTAIQALTLLNSDFVMQVSRQMAKGVSAQHDSETQQVQELYLRLYSRYPSDTELQAATAFVEQTGELSELCRALFSSNEFLYLD